MSQDNPQITTTPPLPGLQLVQDLNKALQTLATDFSGATDPAAMAWPYSTWADTGTGTLKRRNAANSAWMIERNLFEDLRRTASATDTTAGRVLKVGDWGIGGTIPVLSGGDLLADDDYYEYYVTTAVNAPSGALTTSGYVKKETRSSSFRKVTFTPFNLSTGPWVNVCNNGVWAGWVQLYHSGNFSGVKAMTFAQVNALAADQGPIIVTDMGGMLWTWVSTAYFTGYRNPLCATIPQHFAATARAWEMPVTGGVWSESDPKQRRLIAWFREQGLTVASGSWAKGWGRIADLGGGDWKAPDLQDVFFRMAGTDADTANAAGPGEYKGNTLKTHDHQQINRAGGSGPFDAFTGSSANNATPRVMGQTGSTGFAETAPDHVRVLPVVCV
ncbi:hypothetical protein ABRY94_11660 [Castellaniella ginsengisoli]|uniref:Minor tail protein n=1 Tax=Castellaniella ginsengisoli TaxID=546114 RepID=A0AB39ER01_9BURK